MNAFNLTQWALNHRAVVLFLLILITVAGTLGFGKLGQLEDPNFSVPSMTAMVAWPGATAQQLQDEVLNRMEKKFEQLDHFEKVVTFSRQGFGGMTISVKGGTPKADQQEAWYQARKKLADLELELPDGVVGPIFNDEFGDVYGLIYAVKGDGVSLADLADQAEIIKRNLLKVPMVNKIDLLGKQAEKIYIEFSHERLAALGIQPAQIMAALKSQNAILPAGSLDTASDRIYVRVSGQFRNLDDIRNLPIAAGGRVIKLGDFTTVHQGYEDPQSYSIRHNGQQVLMLGVVMTDDGNIVQLGEALEASVAKIQNELPYGLDLELIADQPTTVKEAVWDFERALMEALVIVVIVSLLSLGWRPGLVVALSVPLVLGMVAIVMLGMGWNLERISLGVAHHRPGPAGGRRHHRPGDDDREDGSGLGQGQGRLLLLSGDRHAPSVRRPDHRRRLHAGGLCPVHHGRIRRRHLLDRRRRRGALLDLLGDVHALSCRQDAAGQSGSSPRRGRSL
ncbi:Cobalt-zinc-cadmium resistance protein CzcA [compost metagenome]